MIAMMRVGIALQPIATALFANSPFDNGKPSGYLSWRSHVWQRTDPVRRAAAKLLCIGVFARRRRLHPLPLPCWLTAAHTGQSTAAGR